LLWQEAGDGLPAHIAQHPVAAQASPKGPDRAAEIEPPDHLTELRGGFDGTHAVTVRDEAALQQAAIAGQQDAAFAGRNLSQLLVGVVVPVQRIEP